jgi:hypothetical protein
MRLLLLLLTAAAAASAQPLGRLPAFVPLSSIDPQFLSQFVDLSQQLIPGPALGVQRGLFGSLQAGAQSLFVQYGPQLLQLFADSGLGGGGLGGGLGGLGNLGGNLGGSLGGLGAAAAAAVPLSGGGGLGDLAALGGALGGKGGGLAGLGDLQLASGALGALSSPAIDVFLKGVADRWTTELVNAMYTGPLDTFLEYFPGVSGVSDRIRGKLVRAICTIVPAPPPKPDDKVAVAAMFFKNEFCIRAMPQQIAADLGLPPLPPLPVAPIPPHIKAALRP